MQVKKGDKIKLVKPMGEFDHIGAICEIQDVSNDVIKFKIKNSNMFLGYMSLNELDKYFKKEEEKVKCDLYLTDDYLLDIINKSKIKISKQFENYVIFSVKLPNGVILTEDYAFCNEEEYNEDIVYDVCIDKILHRLRLLEEYKLRCQLQQD